MAEFVMPKLGADMSAGKLIAWRKKPGDSVSRGEIIADVETDKADIEVEVFTSGVIEKFLVEPGQKVPVGTVLAIIREVAGATPEEQVWPTTAPFPAPPPSLPITRETPPLVPETPIEKAGRTRISPSAKKLAAEMGIDVTALIGTGPAGRIVRKDVERFAAESAEPAEADVRTSRQARMRQVIGSTMARSKREIPHYYLSTTIDMSHALSWLTEENLKRPMEDRLLYGVLLIKAVALALRQFPELNGFWLDGKSAPAPDIHVGVAISLRGGGLVAPALHNADQKSLDELMRAFRDVVARARVWSLRSSELSDPTITVTSLGEQGVETVFPIIYPPQVAIVGFGKVVERPWSVEGQIVSRRVITATLAGDHRVADGHRGGLFLAAVDRLLQQPSKL
jgi:pyruvate dehydrogenase E2 component (dihydrolipoyllysine-residue acetyltransferase)